MAARTRLKVTVHVNFVTVTKPKFIDPCSFFETCFVSAQNISPMLEQYKAQGTGEVEPHIWTNHLPQSQLYSHTAVRIASNPAKHQSELLNMDLPELRLHVR